MKLISKKQGRRIKASDESREESLYYLEINKIDIKSINTLILYAAP